MLVQVEQAPQRLEQVQRRLELLVQQQALDLVLMLAFESLESGQQLQQKDDCPNIAGLRLPSQCSVSVRSLFSPSG